MKITSSSQLGFMAFNNPGAIDWILGFIDEQDEQSKHNMSFIYQEELGRAGMTRGGRRMHISEKYLLSKNALQDVRQIKLEVEEEKFSYSIFESILKGKYVTFLLGKELFIRYIITETTVQAIIGASNQKKADGEVKYIEFNFSDISKSYLNPLILADENVKLFLQLLIYTELSDISTKTIINPGRKFDVVSEGNYKNELKEDVTLIDINWNKQIVRVTGFKVRGFFRLQRYGKAWSQIKLIWIDDFEKHGMVKKAGKEL
jgi:hypothetical protein